MRIRRRHPGNERHIAHDASVDEQIIVCPNNDPSFGWIDVHDVACLADCDTEASALADREAGDPVVLGEHRSGRVDYRPR